MIPTFRPWTHTSDDSYMYLLSLVVTTATVSFWFCFLGAAIDPKSELYENRTKLQS